LGLDGLPSHVSAGGKHPDAGNPAFCSEGRTGRKVPRPNLPVTHRSGTSFNRKSTTRGIGESIQATVESGAVVARPARRLISHRPTAFLQECQQQCSALAPISRMPIYHGAQRSSFDPRTIISRGTSTRDTLNVMNN